MVRKVAQIVLVLLLFSGNLYADVSKSKYEKIVEDCLEKKLYYACNKLFEAYILVEETEIKLGMPYVTAFTNRTWFLLQLPCIYRDFPEACYLAVVASLIDSKIALKQAKFSIFFNYSFATTPLDTSEIIRHKTRIVLENEYKKSVFTYNSNCLRKIRFLNKETEKEYKSACKKLKENALKLRKMLKEDFGYTDKELDALIEDLKLSDFQYFFLESLTQPEPKYFPKISDLEIFEILSQINRMCYP